MSRGGGDCPGQGILQARTLRVRSTLAPVDGPGEIWGQDPPLASDARDDIGFHVGVSQADVAA